MWQSVITICCRHIWIMCLSKKHFIQCWTGIRLEMILKKQWILSTGNTEEMYRSIAFSSISQHVWIDSQAILPSMSLLWMLVTEDDFRTSHQPLCCYICNPRSLHVLKQEGHMHTIAHISIAGSFEFYANSYFPVSTWSVSKSPFITLVTGYWQNCSRLKTHLFNAIQWDAFVQVPPQN